MQSFVEDIPCSSPSPLLSEFEIFQIGYYTGQGKGCREIALMLHRSASTISRAITKFLPEFTDSPSKLKPDKDLMRSLKQPFRPRPRLRTVSRSDPIDKMLLHHYLTYVILKDPSISLRRIAGAMSEQKFPFAIQKTQIGYELSSMHIRSIRRIPIPRMTEVNREYRNRFAEEIRTNFLMLLPWLFTDESSITRNATDFTVWRVPGMLDDQNIYSPKEQFPIRIMVWGAIAHDFKSDLIKVEGTLNSDGYKKLITESGVIDHMNDRYGQKAWVFQDDGASAHRAKKTREFLAERCLILSTEGHWPAHSPDLNVIENLWYILKTRMTVSDCQTANDIWLEAQRVWNEISIEEVNQLVDSFYYRLEAVIALNGLTLNGHQRVQQMVKTGYAIQDIQKMIQEEATLTNQFIRESQDLFDERSWDSVNLDELIVESKNIIHKLPKLMRKKIRLMSNDEPLEDIET
jgi:hypothetical protein